MLRAVLFKSNYRFESFLEKLRNFGLETTILDFEERDWIDYDYSRDDIAIYYPLFEFSSNSPMALHKVYDNITYLADTWSHLVNYPDPQTIKYYNDKYRQFLFLQHHKFPIPDTVPLFSKQAVDIADRQLGYPMVLKNRYGAGGGSVFLVHDKKELMSFYRMSKMDFLHVGALRFYASMLRERLFYWELIKAKKMRFPFFSPPLLAQKFVKITRDLKTVVNKDKVVEAHWRYQADKSMWKMNIDGGGTGVWAYVPEEPINLSIRLARSLNANWLNLDLIESKGSFLITEFSPIWHHYAYKEKASFVYKDDYNIEPSLEISLDLERIILESLIKGAQDRKATAMR
jgi:glutathione synthase/RimK-type ligase-like ATP-grasp enzyme